MCRVLPFQGIYCFERRGWEKKKKKNVCPKGKSDAQSFVGREGDD